MKFLSKKLKNIILISVLIFILHGIEEYLTGFYNIDSIFNYVFSYFNLFIDYKLIFIVFQIIWWLVLLVFFLFVSKNKISSLFLILFGLVFIFEVHHIIKALVFSRYYSGLITSFLFPITGFFYWKELIINLKAT